MGLEHIKAVSVSPPKREGRERDEKKKKKNKLTEDYYKFIDFTNNPLELFCLPFHAKLIHSKVFFNVLTS